MAEFQKIDRHTGIIGDYPTVSNTRDHMRKLYEKGYRYLLMVKGRWYIAESQGIPCKYLDDIGPIVTEVMPDKRPRVGYIQADGSLTGAKR